MTEIFCKELLLSVPGFESYNPKPGTENPLFPLSPVIQARCPLDYYLIIFIFSA